MFAKLSNGSNSKATYVFLLGFSIRSFVFRKVTAKRHRVGRPVERVPRSTISWRNAPRPLPTKPMRIFMRICNPSQIESSRTMGDCKTEPLFFLLLCRLILVRFVSFFFAKSSIPNIFLRRENEERTKSNRVDVSDGCREKHAVVSTWNSAQSLSPRHSVLLRVGRRNEFDRPEFSSASRTFHLIVFVFLLIGIYRLTEFYS